MRSGIWKARVSGTRILCFQRFRRCQVQLFLYDKGPYDLYIYLDHWHGTFVIFSWRFRVLLLVFATLLYGIVAKSRLSEGMDFYFDSYHWHKATSITRKRERNEKRGCRAEFRASISAAGKVRETDNKSTFLKNEWVAAQANGDGWPGW